MFRPIERSHPLPPLADRFGVRGPSRVLRDLATVLSHLPSGERFIMDLSTAGFFRPDLSLPAYAGLVPKDGLSPILHFFDRVGGGHNFRAAITRRTSRDYRGGRLTYDEHDGTDFVCPPGTPLACAAPGVVVATRENFLRGGLTACVDHGGGVVTQYTHLSAMVAEVGQPLARGETVALSGMAGLDMISGFPWVAPHVHFMVWIDGRPVDPFVGEADEAAEGEPARPGTWLHGNRPETARGPLAGDPPPPSLSDVAIDRRALDALIERCASLDIRAEIERAPSDAARVAICEDSLHHDRSAWPAEARRGSLRGPGDAASVKLTLPLPASIYQGIRIVDAPWTRPPR